MTLEKDVSISEAPESNAGDDFHKLWAARKALELLNFDDNGLKMIAIEGVEPNEGKEIDETGSMLLSIDLAEYFGGENFNEAKFVIFSQLKYSTRRSNENYTLAKLCTGKKRGNKGSIIEKLADSFKAYLTNNERSSVLDKLKIKLVTNRPIQAQFILNLKSIQDYLANKPGKIQKCELVEQFIKLQQDIDRIAKTTKLSSVDFVDFLRVLNFEDCGTSSRFYQKHLLTKAISQVDNYQLKHHYNALYVLVNDLMMPEYKSRNTLTIDDVIFTFKMGTVESLFPVPQKMEILEKTIERVQLTEIAAEILKKENQVICLHGGAGIGKSTIVKNLHNYFPNQSVTILYDCYGQGEYLNSGEIRHIPEKAFLQIINELSRELGTSFLLSRNTPDYLLPAELKNRLKFGADLLKKSYPDSIITIIIDAADNSVTAAEIKKQKCFVQDLTSIGTLPDNCKIIFTTRTGRINSLCLPENTLKVQIKPFSEEETSQLLLGRFPDVNTSQIKEFHHLTNQTPRIQAYSLKDRDNINQVFEFLKPYGKTVGTLINGHIIEAKIKLGDQKKAALILQLLITLPRPIPINYIAKISNFDNEEILDFCTDLWSGLIVKNNLLSFRDEDFENHLREEYPISLDTYYEISKIFIEDAGIDRYASIHLSEVLYHAKRFSELQEIVLNDKYLSSIEDPLLQKEVFVKRAQLALKSCSSEEDNIVYLKLLALAAEAEKTNKVQLKILQDNIEIIVGNSDLHTIQRLYFDITKNIHYGASNLRCASILSKNEETKFYAKKHLIQAEKWIDFRSKLPEDQMDRFEISEIDLAAGGLALLRLYGIKKATRWLKRWKPKEMMTSVLSSIINDYLKDASDENISSLLKEVIRADVLLLIAISLIDSRKTVPFCLGSLLEKIVKITLRNVKFLSTIRKPIIDFCEHLIYVGGNLNEVKKLLEYFSPQIPEHNTRFYKSQFSSDNDINQLDLFLSYKSILCALNQEQLTPEDIYPNSLKISLSDLKNKELNGDHVQQKKHSLDQLYEILIPIYHIKTSIILKDLENTLINQTINTIKLIEKEWRFRHERHDITGVLNFCFEKLAEYSFYATEKTLYLKSIQTTISKEHSSKIDLYLTLARSAVKDITSHHYAYELLSEIDSILDTSSILSSDKIKYYQECIQIAYNIKDLDEAKLYFHKAIEVAEEIDLEAQDQIRVISEISDSLISVNRPQLAYEYAKFTEYSSNCLDGYDNFPWHHSIVGIEAIDYSSAISTWCRWDHSNLNIDSNANHSFWSERLITGLKNNFIEAKVAASLSRFRQYDEKWLELVDLIISSFVENGDDVNLKKYIKYILRDFGTICEIDRRDAYIERLVPILEKHDIPQNEDFVELMKCNEFLKKEDGGKCSGLDINRRNIDPKSLKFIGDLVENTESCNCFQINDALELIFNYKTYNDQLLIDDFFRQLRDKTNPTEFSSHLDTLLILNDKYFSCYSFRSILKDTFRSWSFKKTIHVWKKANFTRVIEKFLLGFKETDDDFNYVDIGSLEELREMFEENPSSLALVLKKIIPEYIEDFTQESFYQTFSILNNLLTTAQAEELIEWLLSRWNKNLPLDIGEGCWNGKLEPSKDILINFAQFIRYQLGHPKKSQRWDASHALVRMVEFGEPKVLDYLISKREDPSCFPFQHEKHTFFWLSSKLWLFISLDKIATVNPNVLIPYFEILHSEALKTTNAHVLIRKISKSICLKLMQFKPSLVSPKSFAELNSVLVSQYKPIKNDEQKQSRDSNDLKFDFDYFDTLSYWYEGLGHVFGKSSNEIAQIVEKHIFGHLRFTGLSRKLDHVEAEYQETSNDHGSIPKVENLRTYYEYHGMFYAANELCENEPIIENTDDRWNEWLERWGLAWNDSWLSDLRDPTPLENKFWQMNSKPPEIWKWAISSDYLDSLSGLDKLESNDKCLLKSTYERFDNKNRERVNINTSFVSEGNAVFLLRALQTASDFHDYKLPFEDEEDFEIDEDEFKLKPSVLVSDCYADGIDRLDLSTLSLAKIKISPCTELKKWAKLKGSPDNRFYWSEDKNQKEYVTKFQNWSDYYEYKRYMTGFGTNGFRLFIRKELLFSFLKEKSYCLLLECQIDRHIENDDYRIPAHYTKLYLINSDGKIRSITGNIEPRKEDCS